eukprot:GHVS01008534.1.p1 GENE.GHVS01008534.1~~GHVS01008534.1.p1  ORF type:complete len:328 (+),score=56.06 GHVS01008534.1:25-1008(+)
MEILQKASAEQLEEKERREDADLLDRRENSNNFYDTSVVCGFDITDKMIQSAQQLIANDSNGLPEAKKAKLLCEAVRSWDLFYKRNSQNFFKDRQWMKKEFAELRNCRGGNEASVEESLLVEVGCGVGNSLMPILKDNPHISAVGIDCSERAIQMLKERWKNETSQLPAASQGGRLIDAAVADITREDIAPSLCAAGSADMVLLMFVLSAIHPDHYTQVALRCSKLLKPGGVVLLRDYGRYDMAQLRFAKSGKSKIDDNFYTRYDGTFAFYFTTEHLRDIFCNVCGLEEIQNTYHSRLVTNRKTNAQMHRIWIQAKFRKPTVITTVV